MNRIKLGIIFLVALVFSAVLVVHAQSNKEVRSKMVKPKEVAEIKSMAAGLPQTTPFTGSKQGYQLVTDVLDGFGGESESDNYRIPVNSGGQPSAIGLSESANWGVGAGYVLATRVTRGDVNADGIINIGDVVYLVNYLYRSGGEPCPAEAGDVTSDGIVNVGDVVYLVNYLYRGGDPPAC
ncbi:MAG: dockerin type I repeat-containing protein [Candidatus Zixiibacteriota bacterium]|nr:MAG: dockerin type I repeat-containing protein [candidate division Zixibacteria bacterium]